MKRVHGTGDAKLPVRVKKFTCHICPKSYFVNCRLQVHLRSHTGERPFACTLCERRFVDNPYLRKHLKTSHGIKVDEGEKSGL